MKIFRSTRQADERVLNMLDLRDNEGMNTKELIAATGMTRGAISGAAWRVRSEEVPCMCRKRANQDGGMPRFWWDSKVEKQ